MYFPLFMSMFLSISEVFILGEDVLIIEETILQKAKRSSRK